MILLKIILEIGEIETEGFNTNSSIVVSSVKATVEGGEPVDVSLYEGKYTYNESLADVLAGKDVTFRAYITWEDENNAADTANGAGSVTSVVVPVTS